MTFTDSREAWDWMHESENNRGDVDVQCPSCPAKHVRDVVLLANEGRQVLCDPCLKVAMNG